MTDEISIRELKGLDELILTFPLIQREHPERVEAIYRERLSAMLAQGGYRCIAAYAGERMMGVAGFWIGTQQWSGKYIEGDNVVVDAELRSRGIGAKLMEWIEAEGERLGCDILRVAMLMGKTRTKRFYNSLGFSDDGLMLVKPLSRGETAFPEYVAQKTERKT